MKPWLWMTLCLGCLAVAGCRANTYRTALEQESRQWEERYYIAQDRLEECQSMLDATMPGNRCMEGATERSGSPRSPAAGKTPAGGMPGMSNDDFPPLSSSPLNSKQPGRSDREEVKPPADSSPGQPGRESIAPLYPSGPSMKLPGGNNDRKPMPETQRLELPDSKSPLKSDEPRRLDDPLSPGLKSETAPDVKPPLKLSGDSSEVASVELIGMSSDGFNTDGRPGDEGIQFILQPRDRHGRPITAAGPVSVVVVDPLPAGKSIRVARWDLSARQTAGYLNRSPQGFHLRLPWPSMEPKHSRLRLFARYTASDGRKIQAEKTIEVNLPGQPPPTRKIARPRRRTDPPKKTRVAVSKPSRHEPSRQRPVWLPDRR